MNLEGQTGELRFTIEIKRAETGEVEVHELIGKIVEEEEDGGNALHGGA